MTDEEKEKLERPKELEKSAWEYSWEVPCNWKGYVDERKEGPKKFETSLLLKKETDKFILAIVILLGIILVISGLLLSMFWGNDTAEQAWAKVKDSTVSGGVSVQFTGRAENVTIMPFVDPYAARGNDYVGWLDVSGFGAPVYFGCDSEIREGDLITVSGKYYPGLGYVAGDIGPATGTIYPATVTKGKRADWGVYFIVVVIVGIIILIFGIACYSNIQRRISQLTR